MLGEAAERCGDGIGAAAGEKAGKADAVGVGRRRGEPIEQRSPPRP